MVVRHLPRLRAAQERLMTETCSVLRDGLVAVSDIPCRTHHARLFTATPDPQDANTRDLTEIGLTIPERYHDQVFVGDTFRLHDHNDLEVIAGEVLKHDTWRTAIRIWASEPKDAVDLTEIRLYRLFPPTEEWQHVGTYTVHVHFSRNMPEEIPIRYSQQGATLNKDGTIASQNGVVMDVRAGDRFTLPNPADINKPYPCVIQYVLPTQPQRTEAAFTMDVGGPRGTTYG
jgi:hypothetical protein